MINDFRGKYRWLSNFHLCDIEFEGIIYPSTEHAYQAAKTLDIEERKSFLGLTCKEAKKKGMQVKLRDNWDNIKFDIMYQLNKQKYYKYKELAHLLLDTKDEELVEQNTWNDTFYGVCNGIGQNNLGKILMNIRTELQIDYLNFKGNNK